MKRISTTLLLAILIISSCTSIPNGKTEGITIGEIQGCSQVSPFDGDKVTGVGGIVTHKFSNGFTMQSQKNDDLPCSSEAIFVMTGDYPSVFPGQMITVDGIVNEFTPGKPEDHNLSRTELHDPVIKLINESELIPQPVILGTDATVVPSRIIKQTSEFDIKNNGLDYYESLEFMLVQIEGGIVVGPKNQYNEFFVLPKGYVAANSISLQGVLLQKKDDENPEKIMVDVASSFTQDVNVGDTFNKPIIGIMDYSFGNYKIWTIKNPIIQSNKVPGPLINSDDQTLRIASYNIENFSRFDEGSRVHKLGCQIARDLNSPDIVVLHEVMDDSGTVDDHEISSNQTLRQLIEAIKDCGGDRYTFSDNPPINNQDGGIEGGNIRSILLYREDLELTLDPPTAGIGGLVFQDGKIRINQNPLRLFTLENEFNGTRKPTVWLFTFRGEQYIVIGLHLVSQSANSPDWGNLQPLEKPEQKKRVMQMNLVGNYINDILSQNPELNLILLGDFNDYPWSDTLKVLDSNSLSVLISTENPNEEYSYIHEGNGFKFDYAAVSNNLVERISSYTILHINTFLNVKDQISDHDPVYFEISGN